MGNIEKFNQIASQYDTQQRKRIAQIIAKEVKKYIVKDKHNVAFDFGCGTGLVGFELLEDFDNIIFIDASYFMVEQVKNKIEMNNITNASAICIDFEKQKNLNIKADYIIVAQVLLHIQNIESILSKLFDMLNDGGHLIIVDFDKNELIISDEVHNGFDQKGLSNILYQIGYKEIKSENFYTEDNMFMNKKASLFILDCKKN